MPNLTKLDDLYKRVIYDNTEDHWYRKITKDTEFMEKYLSKFDDGMSVTKTRLNTFQFAGCIDNVIKAFESLKVDEDFWNEQEYGKNFALYSPLYTLGEIVHLYNNDEYYSMNPYVENNTTWKLNNECGVSFDGRWKSFYEQTEGFEYPVKIKEITPQNLAKKIKELNDSLEKTQLGRFIIVEFQVNCEGLANQIWDEEAKFVPETDEALTIGKEETEKANVETTMPKSNEKTTVKVPQKKTQKDKVLNKAVINSYDSKNKFKKTTKEIK